ncbi:MAG: ABC transporter permease [Methanogenium sp.]|nr:ABC transporter permease [Methanogenium sp.]
MFFFNLAVKNLKKHWIRSFLSIIGIIVGVIAIASLGIMGNSINLLVANLITDVGDTIVVIPHTSSESTMAGDPRTATVSAFLTQDQLNDIIKVASPHRTIPIMQSSGEVTFGSNKGGLAQIIGLEADDIAYLLELEDGQYLRRNMDACLVGTFLAKEYDLRPGMRIQIGDEKVRIAGILKERGFAIDINPDYAVVVTKKWYSAHFDIDKQYAMAVIKVTDMDEIKTVVNSVDDYLNRREDEVDVFDSQDLLNQYEEIYDQITSFLLAIGAISLVVAAINILNVMYISVSERIREIGILRSLGMRRNEVMQVFLYEAIILGVIGSIIGGVFSIAGGYVVSVFAIQIFTAGTTFGENVTVFNETAVAYIIFAMVFGILTSILSGLHPAWKASRLSPIEALRHE